MEMVDAGEDRCLEPELAAGRRRKAEAVWVGALAIRNKLKSEANQSLNLSLINIYPSEFIMFPIHPVKRILFMISYFLFIAADSIKY